MVEPLLSADSVYRLVDNEIAPIVSDEGFLDMYATGGRSAVNPVVLALVLVFQFPERLPDRAAAEAAVMRLDWKYALCQELTWVGFHYSDLCNFCKRLLEYGREWVVFERVVSYLRERGYIPERGKQRTDSTKNHRAGGPLKSLGVGLGDDPSNRESFDQCGCMVGESTCQTLPTV